MAFVLNSVDLDNNVQHIGPPGAIQVPPYRLRLKILRGSSSTYRHPVTLRRRVPEAKSAQVSSFRTRRSFEDMCKHSSVPSRRHQFSAITQWNPYPLFRCTPTVQESTVSRLGTSVTTPSFNSDLESTLEKFLFPDKGEECKRISLSQF